MNAATGPTAFLLGVAKAGTSSLARSLDDHPEVYVPETKEPNYQLLKTGPLNNVGPASPKVIDFLLHRFSIGDDAGYEALFAPGATCPVRLDGSVRYLYHPAALERIAEHHPDARHIVVLRDPAERALSHWRMNRRYHLEPLDLQDALDAEDDRVAEGWGWDWHYRRLGTYGPQLRRLFELFPRSHIMVVLYGDFVANPESTVASCFEHLGVAPRPVDLSYQAMKPSEPHFRTLDRVLQHPTKVRRILRTPPGGAGLVDRVRTWNSRAPGPVDPTAMQNLRDLCRYDLAELATLLGTEEAELMRRMQGRPAPRPIEGTR